MDSIRSQIFTRGFLTGGRPYLVLATPCSILVVAGPNRPRLLNLMTRLFFFRPEVLAFPPPLPISLHFFSPRTFFFVIWFFFLGPRSFREGRVLPPCTSGTRLSFSPPFPPHLVFPPSTPRTRFFLPPGLPLIFGTAVDFSPLPFPLRTLLGTLVFFLSARFLTGDFSPILPPLQLFSAKRLFSGPTSASLGSRRVPRNIDFAPFKSPFMVSAGRRTLPLQGALIPPPFLVIAFPSGTEVLLFSFPSYFPPPGPSSPGGHFPASFLPPGNEPFSLCRYRRLFFPLFKSPR